MILIISCSADNKKFTKSKILYQKDYMLKLYRSNWQRASLSQAPQYCVALPPQGLMHSVSARCTNVRSIVMTESQKHFVPYYKQHKDKINVTFILYNNNYQISIDCILLSLIPPLRVNTSQKFCNENLHMFEPCIMSLSISSSFFYIDLNS